MTLSPDGHTLATGLNDGAIRLWNVTNPAHPRPLGHPLTNSYYRASAVAFSTDSRTLATGNDDGTIQLWNITNPAHPQPLGQPLTSGNSAYVDAVAFSADGHTLVSGNNDGIRLWSIPSTILTTSSGTTSVRAVAFSRNDCTLATGRRASLQADLAWHRLTSPTGGSAGTTTRMLRTLPFPLTRKKQDSDLTMASGLDTPWRVRCFHEREPLNFGEDVEDHQVIIRAGQVEAVVVLRRRLSGQAPGA